MAEVKIKPLGKNILVKPEEAEKTSKMGIVLVEKEAERPQSGVVVALGDGEQLPNGQMTTFTVKVGDKVMFKKYGGTEMELDGEKLMMMTENDILGILQ